MAVYLSPVGLSTAQVPNRVSLLATYKERLCRRICENSTNQPEAFVTYKTGTPIFNGTTVFVPVIATVTIVTPGCGCQATTQVIVSSIRNEPEDWQNRDGSRCYYRGQWKNGNLRYS